MSLPRWNGKFELPDESYFVVDIQDYFEYIIKKHQKGSSSSNKYVFKYNRNRITFIELKKNTILNF